MLQQRANYWSNSKVAYWLRKVFKAPPQPHAATMEEWNEFHAASKAHNKFLDWVIEELFDSVQRVIYWPYDAVHEIRYYVKNRFFDKLHYLPTRLKKGEYNGVETRLLHGMMETLVDFVEVEKAHMHQMFGQLNDERALRYKFPLLRWSSIRSREFGLEYLKWEASLDDVSLPDYDPMMGMNSQAHAAREVIAIYTWWKDVRPNRADPYDASGWSEYCDRRHADLTAGYGFFAFTDKTPEEKDRTSTMLNLIEKIETEYALEDEEMMVRLVKIRGHLWT